MGLSMPENASEKSAQQLEELAVENITHIEILLVSRLSIRKQIFLNNLLEKASEKSVQQLEELAVENTIHIEILLVC